MQFLLDRKRMASAFALILSATELFKLNNCWGLSLSCCFRKGRFVVVVELALKEFHCCAQECRELF